MVIHEQKLYFWGGYTQDLVQDDTNSTAYPEDKTLPDTEDNFMDVYDIASSHWERHATRGDVPDFGNGSTMVSYGDHLYLFGGWNEGDFTSEVYQINVTTFVWKHLEITQSANVVKPGPRYLTEAVLYNGKMWIFGGVGPPPTTENPIQRGAKYIGFVQYDHDYGFGWNNEMFYFDLDRRK